MKKTILITGSTDGIGKIAANKLAMEGHEIILHGRNPKKLELTIQELITESNNSNIKGYVANFSNLDEVKKLAKNIKSDYSKIDVIINNAGIFKSSAETKSGIDIRIVVNYLAPYLLTNE
jgi:short-subunit dehydrogenase